MKHLVNVTLSCHVDSLTAGLEAVGRLRDIGPFEVTDAVISQQRWEQPIAIEPEPTTPAPAQPDTRAEQVEQPAPAKQIAPEDNPSAGVEVPTEERVRAAVKSKIDAGAGKAVRAVMDKFKVGNVSSVPAAQRAAFIAEVEAA